MVRVKPFHALSNGTFMHNADILVSLPYKTVIYLFIQYKLSIKQLF